MIQLNNLSKKAEALADDLDELGVDVIDVEPVIEHQAFRVIAEADNNKTRNEAVLKVASAYQHAVHTLGESFIQRFDMEIHQSDGAGVVQFTIRREWLPADRGDVDGWDEMFDRVNQTHEVIHGD